MFQISSFSVKIRLWNDQFTIIVKKTNLPTSNAYLSSWVRIFIIKKKESTLLGKEVGKVRQRTSPECVKLVSKMGLSQSSGQVYLV